MEHQPLIEKLTNLFAELPGVGRKTAFRYALDIVQKDHAYAFNLAQALVDVKQQLKKCSVCNNISDHEVCHICSDHYRNKSVICVVEDYQDVIAIENMKLFSGVYHLLGGLISPINGVGPSQLNIETLLKRIENNMPEEIIIALNATMEGETTTMYLFKKLSAYPDIKFTTLAKGLSAGEDLNYADELTLSRSFLNRIPIN